MAGAAGCATADATDFPGSANYRLPLGAGQAFTLMGSPTIVAKLISPGPVSQLAARLLDVGPDGKETLVARGLYRPDMTTAAARQVFQLHPSGWRFEPGHTVKLELLTADAPYSRPSNAGLPVLVSDLELRRPSAPRPSASGARSQPGAPLSDCCSADSSPTPCHGRGSSWSTCPLV
ncbi:MAG: CocE/NonD family hydrolase C-terminal non-catalytic domain-containing protein [Baekduia sp.]